MSLPHDVPAAHILRRAVHLSNLALLWIYYEFGDKIAHFFNLSLPVFICILVGIIWGLEALRLWRSWTIFGQRYYERDHISALAWGALGTVVVLLLAPGKAFAVPIISTYAIVDPLLGELRRMCLSKIVVVAIGLITIAGIWWLAHLTLGTPSWLIFLMAPVTLAAEWPCLKWIDDNALMQIIPLIIVKLDVLIFN